jgi:Molybdopterin-binding domain of aldehyde dehydrogenase
LVQHDDPDPSKESHAAFDCANNSKNRLRRRGARGGRVEFQGRQNPPVADCGKVLNPGIARAGIEGGVVFGIAYCKSEVRFDHGRIQQDNLSTYVMPYLATCLSMRRARRC